MAATRTIDVSAVETIRRPAAEVYAFWRDFTQLSQIMDERVSVAALSSDETRWVVRVPGRTIAWNARLVADEAERLLAWRSLPGSDVANSGNVRFEPLEDGRATTVTLSYELEPPSGIVGKLAAGPLREALAHEARKTLQRLKARLESGGQR
jgi:uncharacterized membrane protein